MKLKDDLLKKIKGILSGSANLSSDTKNEVEETQKKTQDELVNNFMDQILESSWVEEELKSTITPSYHLSKKEKNYWLLNTQIKSFIRVKGGVEIVPMELGKNNSICLIGHGIFSIPSDLLVYTGWN
jgi:hypothetical protein